LKRKIEKAVNDKLVLRMIQTKVFLAPSNLVKKAGMIPRKCLLHVGTMIGQFTHTKNQFNLHTPSLEVLSPLAKYKLWLKPSGEQSYL